MDWKALAEKAREKAGKAQNLVQEFLDQEQRKLDVNSRRYEKYSEEELKRKLQKGEIKGEEGRYAAYAYYMKTGEKL